MLQIERPKISSNTAAAITHSRRVRGSLARGNDLGPFTLIDYRVILSRMRIPVMRIMLLLVLSAALCFAADITGKWTFNVVLDAGSGSPTFEFKQSGEKLTGTYHGQFGEAPLTGTVKGDKVEFTFGGDLGTVTYSGTLESDTRMKGACDYGGQAKGTFTATKN